MRRLLLCMALIGLLAGLSGIGPVSAAAEKKQQQVVAPPGTASANSSDYIGSEVCATCHAAEVKKFSANPHSDLALTHGGKGATCEGCHGPGKAHVESGGDKTKIFQFTQASPAQVSSKCLGCHAGVHPNFDRSPHAKAGLSCTTCHSNHSFQSGTQLLKASQPKLCYTCHTDVKPAFAAPFHHRVDEGLLKCSDCHDPHGTFQPTQLRSTADQNAICTKCHSEKAGPFVYEHPVVKVEGCTACHSPHGSQNPRLLNESNVNTLCLQCHSATNPGVSDALSPQGPVHNQSAQFVVCTNCHTQIHGSNASSVFFK